MGNKLFPKTVNQLYQPWLQEINLVQIKDQWSAIKRFKIKRIFDRFAQKCYNKNNNDTSRINKRMNRNSSYSRNSRKNKNESEQNIEGSHQKNYLEFQNFCEMFPEFIRYETQQKKRIYQIFDRNRDGVVDWEDFFTTISICYFCSEKTLAILMFMIFDEKLEKQIDRINFTLLLDLNAFYFREDQNKSSNQKIKTKNFEVLPEGINSNIKSGCEKNSKSRKNVKIAGNKNEPPCSIFVKNIESIRNASFKKVTNSCKTINNAKNTMKSFSNYYCEQQIKYYEPEQILDNLLGDKQKISLSSWLQQCHKYIDFNQYKRFFNIFKEEKLEKQLVQNFEQWNHLYNEEQEKYVSYIVSFKWYEAWRIYIELQYGVHFSLEDKNPTTLKSLKTKKSLKTNNSHLSQKKNYRQLSAGRKLKFQGIFPDVQSEKQSQYPEQLKNFDMIHNIIGECPKYIYNDLLEFQYEQTLKPGLVENHDYVFVSQKIWNHLKEIYDGFPEFRRTGHDQIQLYPKSVKIYSGIFKDEISYSTQVIRQVSNYANIEELMVGSIQIQKSQLKEYRIFYRTIGMDLWQQVKNISTNFSDLTDQTIIFLIYLENGTQDLEKFMDRYLKLPENISNANLGDVLLYTDPVLVKQKQKQQYKAIILNKIPESQKEKQCEKQVVFFSKTLEGKFILHFIGKHYNENLCLTTREFNKLCKLKKREKIYPNIAKKTVYSPNYNPLSCSNMSAASQEIHRPIIPNNVASQRRIGIEGCKNHNIGFLISTVLHFHENTKLRNALIPLTYKQNENAKTQLVTITLIMGYISHLLLKNMKVQAKNFLTIIDQFFPGFASFDISMCSIFFEEFAASISLEFDELAEAQQEHHLAIKSKKIRNNKVQNIVEEDYRLQVTKIITCPQCKIVSNQVEDKSKYILNIEIPQRQTKCYEIFVVPFTLQIIAEDPKNIRKYQFQLHKNSTFKNYRDKLEELADLRHKPYVLLEICGNDIIKNFSHVNPDAQLQSLYLREDDKIFAYQLYIDFQIFVRQHYSYPVEKSFANISGNHNKNFTYNHGEKYLSDHGMADIEERQIKVDQLIDCKSEKKGWIVGKVVQKDIMPYTYKQKVKVMHKMSKNQVYMVQYQVQRGIVANFPMRSYRNAEIYHLKVQQRDFNESMNEMKKCSIPLVIALPNWMRFKQFRFLIYLQMQRFITEEQRFSFDSDEDRMRYYSKGLGENKKTREANKVKLKKFKQYLKGKQLPYKINFSDSDGRCIICYKIIKSIVYKGQYNQYCQGCSLPRLQQPICWQVRLAQLVVMIDWKNKQSYRHIQKLLNSRGSYRNQPQNKKIQTETIQGFILSYFTEENEEYNELLCCNKQLQMKYYRRMTKFPNILVVNLVRIAEQNSFKKNVRRPIGFASDFLKIPSQDISKLSGSKSPNQKNITNYEYYRLIGVTTYNGHHGNFGFQTFIREKWSSIQGTKIQLMDNISYQQEKVKNAKEKWIIYKGEKVYSTTKEEIDKRCTLVYYYQKITHLVPHNHDSTINDKERENHQFQLDTQIMIAEEILIQSAKNLEQTIVDEGQGKDIKGSMNQIEHQTESNKKAKYNDD